MAIIVIIYIAHAQWCLHSTSCLDRTGSVQFVQEVHTKNNEIMNNDNRPPACSTGDLIDQQHIYN